MTPKDRLALSAYMEMLDDTVDLRDDSNGMNGGDPVRLLIAEHDRLDAELQRLQSSPAPVGVEVRDWLTTSDVIEAFGSWEDSKPWAYIADDLNRIVASRLPAIKPGEVETCEWHPGDIPGTGVRGWKTACGEAMYPKHRWRLGVDGLNYCPNCGKRAVQVSDDEWAARSAQDTTTKKETPC